MSDLISVEQLVKRFFRAKTTPLCGYRGAVLWSTWTCIEKYRFSLYPPGRKGSPDTDHLWFLRIDSRNSGTSFNYDPDPEKLLVYAKTKMAEERRLDLALIKAYESRDYSKAKNLEIKRFLRHPITA